MAEEKDVTLRECPHCWGDGEIEMTDHWDMLCPACNGTGEINV